MSMTEARVARIPDCDVCKFDLKKSGVPAAYDAKLKMGPWGYVCEEHFQSHTNRELGLGKGQRLIVDGEGK
jgi:hypothetical protein